MKYQGCAKALLSAILLGWSGTMLAANSDAVLSKFDGTVLVNQGQSYVTAREGMKLQPGDQLMVMEGGNAQIDYADGCNYELKDNQVLRITDKSACVTAAATAVGPYYAQAIGNQSDAGGPPPQSNANNIALIVAGITAVCVAECFGDGSTTVEGTPTPPPPPAKPTPPPPPQRPISPTR